MADDRPSPTLVFQRCDLAVSILSFPSKTLTTSHHDILISFTLPSSVSMHFHLCSWPVEATGQRLRCSCSSLLLPAIPIALNNPFPPSLSSPLGDLSPQARGTYPLHCMLWQRSPQSHFPVVAVFPCKTGNSAM